MLIKDLKRELAEMPDDAEVYMITERHDLQADIIRGGDYALSAGGKIEICLGLNQVRIYEETPIGYLNGPGKEEAINDLPKL